jgi:hypothetical protein
MQAVPIEDLPREDCAVQAVGTGKNLSSSRLVVGVRGKEDRPGLRRHARRKSLQCHA